LHDYKPESFSCRKLCSYLVGDFSIFLLSLSLGWSEVGMDPGSRLPIPMAVAQLLEAVVSEVAQLSEELA